MPVCIGKELWVCKNHCDVLEPYHSIRPSYCRGFKEEKGKDSEKGNGKVKGQLGLVLKTRLMVIYGCGKSVLGCSEEHPSVIPFIH